jgi:hypothetical protein
MPKYFGPVRQHGQPDVPNTTANSPVRPLGIPPILPVAEEEGYADIPYPGDLQAGDGADRGYTPACKTSGYSTNVSQPDNKGPVKNSGDQGLGVM